MATAESVARSVFADLSLELHPLIALRWINERYKALATRIRFRHLLRIGELTVPAAVQTGLVTVSRGSRIVTGDAAAITAWSTENAGWFFRGSKNWHEIDSVDLTAGTLTLKTPYAEADIASGGYTLVQRFIPVAKEADRLGDKISFPRQNLILDRMSFTELNFAFPDRNLVSDSLGHWAEAPHSPSETDRRIEVYPYIKSNDEILHYVYWLATPDISTLEEELPPDLDINALKIGILIDAYRFLKGRALAADELEKGSIWRNEERAQETKWRTALSEAARRDRGSDDISLILRSRFLGEGSSDIVTAFDQVWST